MMEKVFIWIDVNSAFISFASVESLEQGGMDYRKYASVVSQPPGVRGAIVAAASQPAKDLGVRVPEHINSALQKCPDLIIVEPDFEVYKKWSQKFKEICREFAENFESFSIDECVINPKLELLSKYSGPQIADKIRLKIKEKCGFEVTCGVSFTKTFSKIASDYKPGDRVYYLSRENFKKHLWPLPVDRLIYCGPKSKEKLEKAKINTIGELANADLDKIKMIVGNKHGEALWLQANGLDDSEVVTERPERKSLSREVTLQENINDIEKIKDIYIGIINEACNKLKQENLQTKRIGIKLRDYRFNDRNYYKTLKEYTSDKNVIQKVVEELLDANYKAEALRQLGIKFERLTKAED